MEWEIMPKFYHITKVGVWDSKPDLFGCRFSNYMAEIDRDAELNGSYLCLLSNGNCLPCYTPGKNKKIFWIWSALATGIKENDIIVVLEGRYNVFGKWFNAYIRDLCWTMLADDNLDLQQINLLVNVINKHS